MTMNSNDLEYVGFWARVGASLIDTLILLLILTPILVAVYGWEYFNSEKLVQGPADVLISWVLPSIACIWLWCKLRATPGKMAIGAVVVDADTGEPISLRQAVIRYLGYFVSTIPLGLGLLWVAFDDRKQGWHDKMANTVVVRSKHRGTKAVEFQQR
jgi:uncharacterized RDD family membrane protein YckC